MPICDARVRTAPSVRFSSRAILGTGVRANSSRLSRETSSVVQILRTPGSDSPMVLATLEKRVIGTPVYGTSGRTGLPEGDSTAAGAMTWRPADALHEGSGG